MNTINMKEYAIQEKEIIAKANKAKYLRILNKVENRKKYWKDCLYVKNYFEGQLNNKQYTLLCDLIYRRYIYIKQDLIYGRVTANEIEILIDVANSVRKVFNKLEIFHCINKCS